MDSPPNPDPTIILVGPNPFTNPLPPIASTAMAPITAQFSSINVNANSFASPLMPCVESSSGTIKRKRGRPRKYFPNGNIASDQATDLTKSGQPIKDLPEGNIASPSTAKRGRGRPRGSKGKKKQVLRENGFNGSDFSPHLITINHGEDIVAKVTTFYERGPKTEICILAANVFVSTVDFYHSGRINTYEGQYEVVNLSAMLEPSENNNGPRRMIRWNVSLGGFAGGALVGGIVAGRLIAGSARKIILGTFNLKVKKTIPNNLGGGPSLGSVSNVAAFETPTSLSFERPSAEPLGDTENNPLNQGPGMFENIGQLVLNMPSYQ